MTRELSPKAAAALLKKAFSTKNVKLTHTEALDLVARLKGFEAWSHLQSARTRTTAQIAEVATAPATAAAPTGRSLTDVLAQHYGAWGELTALPRRDWHYEVENGDTNLGYWPWVASTLQARDLYAGPLEFEATEPTEVTLPDGTRSAWLLEHNLTDRWGDFNPHGRERKPGLALLELDDQLDQAERLTARLRGQMWGESTFVVRKDGEFGLLFEVEYTSWESETENGLDSSVDGDDYKPHAVVVDALLKGLRSTQAAFPAIEMCVPDKEAIAWERPAVWAFVPLDTLDLVQRTALGGRLTSL